MHASARGRSSVKSIHNSDHRHTSHHVFTFRASLCAAAQASRATAFGGRRGCAGVLPLQEVRAPARPGRLKPLDGDTVRPALPPGPSTRSSARRGAYVAVPALWSPLACTIIGLARACTGMEWRRCLDDALGRFAHIEDKIHPCKEDRMCVRAPLLPYDRQQEQ